MQKLTFLKVQIKLMIKWLYLANYLVLRVGNFTQKLFELLEPHLEPFYYNIGMKYAQVWKLKNKKDLEISS